MKKHSSIYTILSLITLLAFSCKKDTTVVEPLTNTTLATISGKVVFDNGEDTTPHEEVANILVYYGDSALISEIFPRPADSLASPFDQILNTYTDINGNYSFEGLPPSQGNVIVIAPPVSVYNLAGTDQTPDGDPLETESFVNIHVALEEDEELDDGNDFYAWINETAITGQVLEDLDNDGIGDIPKAFAAIELHYRQPNGQPINDPILAVVNTDSEGKYEILYIPLGEYVLVATDNPNFDVISGGDSSPDPDGIGDPNYPTLIPVDLGYFETDEDNDFVVEAEPLPIPTISGFVLEDIDNDLVGDLPVPGHRIELYNRNADGVPVSSNGMPIDAMNSDADGRFYFSDIPPGEYVLYQIGTGNYPYECLMGADLSPEPGEPTGVQCIFIPIDIVNEDEPDSDNTFVIKKL